MLLYLFPLISAALHFTNDADLIRRLRERDPEAMGELYDRFGRLTYALIFRIVRNSAVAEDLVQETFLRIWNRIHAFSSDKGALGPWVLAVARNRAIDYLRSLEGRRQESSIQMEKLEEPALFADFEQDILNIDRVRVLKDALARLTPNQRTVIELAYFEGLTQSEMAERLKQPLGTVKTWVRSALQVLRQEIAGVTA